MNLNPFHPKIPATQAFDVVFKNRFMFRVPEIAFLDEKEVTRRGTNTTGNRNLDYDVMNQPVMRSLTPAAAAVIKSRKYRLGLVVPAASVKIYEGLQAHLEHWANYVSRQSFNSSRAPLEDLLILEDFCAAVFMEARKHFTPEQTAQRVIGTRLNLDNVGMGAVNKLLKKNKAPESQEAPQEPQDDGPQRASLTHYFMNAMMEKAE